jgi:hypothetical protein
MKILKQGKKYNPNWIYRTTCIDCGGKYEFQKADLEKIHVGDEGMSVGFRCPNDDCMAFIEAPDWVRPFEDSPATPKESK